MVVNVGQDTTLKARIGWQGLTTAEYRDVGEYLLVTGTDFKNGFVYWDSCHFVEKIRYEQDRNIQLKNGDVVITKDGTIGKVGYIDNLKLPATLNSGVFVIRPKKDKKIDTKYLYYVFTSKIFNEFLSKLTAGSTINHLYQKDFVNFEFEAPDETEQRKIAKALSDTDELIDSLQSLIEKKENIKLGTMQQLLTGKKRLKGFSEKWKVVDVDEIAFVSRGRIINHNEIRSSINKDYPVYSSQTSNNGIMGYIDTYDFEGEYLTWTTDGVNAGKVFYRFGKFNCTNVCGTLKIKKHDAKFISLVLDQVTKNYVSTNLANPKLMNDVMKQIKLKVPLDIEEQKAIATILSDIDQEIESLKQKLEKTKAIKEAMMDELLTGKTRLIKG